MNGRRLFQGLIALLGVAVAPLAATAETGPWAQATLADGAVVEARLVAAVAGVGELERIPAGLQIRLDQGWKTYWRSPGDAGLAPVVDWSASTNLYDVAWDWPAPHRFELFGIDTFGYGEEVVFPLELLPATVAEPVTVAGRLDLLVCSDICVPVTLDLALDLPAASAASDPEPANLIDRWRALVPGDGQAAGLTIDRVEAMPAGEGQLLRVAGTTREPLYEPDLFVEGATGWKFGRPEFAFAGGTAFTAEVPVLDAPDGASLVGVPVTLTLADGPLAIEKTALPLAGEPVAAAAPVSVLLLALLGGLILNLMPCVLPVLSLKLLSVLGVGGRSPAQVRLGFLATAAGILFSFMVLAAGLIVAKAAGGAVGWGIQFQQPLFLVFMVVLLTLFAGNLAGLFEFRLPGRVADIAGTASGQGWVGHFATGAFATLLATPCSAPFLGTSVGYALSRGTPEILMIFAALGVGLALPYLVIAAAPRLVRLLPRPGRWMIRVRQVLAVALVLAAVWLLSVLAVVEANWAVPLIVAVLMTGFAVVLWRRRRLGGSARFASSVLAAVFAAAAFVAPGQFTARFAAPAVEQGFWTPFDRAAIAGLVADGRTVFVDVTAEWCVTCLANKLLVLSTDEVGGRLAKPEVAAMRADWTRPDPVIADFLAEHGRYGIPFYIVYGPGLPDGLVLPELLTAGAVTEALDRAAAAD